MDELPQQPVESTPPKDRQFTVRIEIEGTPKGEVFRIEARRYLFVATNAGMLLWAVPLSLIAYLRIGPVGILLTILGVAAYAALDYVLWEKRGIRAIEVDGWGLNVFRGKHEVKQRVGIGDISGIDFFNKLGRNVINVLLLGGQSRKVFPGVTLFSGPRIRIVDDAFNDGEFAVFKEKLQELSKKIIQA